MNRTTYVNNASRQLVSAILDHVTHVTLESHASMSDPKSWDITPLEYHLFCFQQNSFHGTRLALRDACENQLIQFFNQKPQKFYTLEIPSNERSLIQARHCSLQRAADWLLFPHYYGLSALEFEAKKNIILG